ncbi:ABC transporter substrate-binding protein [Streptomyces mayteni]
MSHRTRIARSTLATLSGATALSLVLAGCSDSGSSEGTGPAGGDLVIGVTSDPDTLFPWKATQFQAVNVLENIYGSLTELDSDMTVVPGIAEEWETSDDSLTLTFFLREGVTFQDGSALDSADVVFSLESIKDEATAAVAATSLAAVESVEAPDEHTVQLNLSSPDASLPANLASVNMAILSSDDTEEELNSQPNGTGPFTFDNRVSSQSITLVRNEEFWGYPAGLAGLEFRVIPDESAIVSALQSGNVQMAVFDDPLVAQTAESGEVTVDSTAQLSYHALMLNARRGDLEDVNVRLAVQCAIDRQQVLDTAALGEGEVTGPVTSPAFRSDPQARPCPERDLDRAAEYLADSGRSNVTIDAIVSQGEYATSVNEAQNIQAQLAEAGITLELEVLESGAYVDRWVAGDFEAAVALNGGNPDPNGMYGRYFTSDGNLNAVAGYSSPELDELFAEGRSIEDPEERREIYRQISAHLEENAAWIWMFTSYSYTALTSSVQGFTPMPNGSLRFLRTTALTS